MLSRFHPIPERYGQTDRRTDYVTDRIAISISRVSVLTRDKNKSTQRAQTSADAKILTESNANPGFKSLFSD